MPPAPAVPFVPLKIRFVPDKITPLKIGGVEEATEKFVSTTLVAEVTMAKLPPE